MPAKSNNRLPDLMPEAFVSEVTITRAVSRAIKAGGLRKLDTRLYSRNLSDPPEAIVSRNLWQIVAGYFPGALIADRTALENAPASDGSVCLITDGGRDVSLPGHTLRPRRGQHVARCLGQAEIEQRLESLIRRSGEAAINRLRDEIRELAPKLELASEADTLDAVIGVLLGTREAALTSPIGIARKLGSPYDPGRLALFHTLHGTRRRGTDFRARFTRIPPQCGECLRFFMTTGKHWGTLGLVRQPPVPRCRHEPEVSHTQRCTR